MLVVGAAKCYLATPTRVLNTMDEEQLCERHESDVEAERTVREAVDLEEESLTLGGGDGVVAETSRGAIPEASLSDVFLDKLFSLPNHPTISNIRSEQESMYRALEIANWKLASLNEVSEATFQEHAPLFRQHVRKLQEMKKELDSIFRRIRTLKAKASVMYPEAYAAAQERASTHDDNEDDR